MEKLLIQVMEAKRLHGLNQEELEFFLLNFLMAHSDECVVEEWYNYIINHPMVN